MEDKYIELLVKRCLKVNSKTPLFISYKKVNYPFVSKLVEYAKKLGATDIYLDESNPYYIHDFLQKSSIEEIKNNKKFNCAKWDEYAKKDAAFLMLESEIPYLMDDIDSKKLAAFSEVKMTTKPVYKERQLKSEIAWCIAAVPNKEWAKDIFPKSSNPLKDFWQVLGKICMLDQNDPIKKWDKFLNNQLKIQEKLNNLKISKLHYTNSLGTDFEVSLSDATLWSSASSGKWIVNLPSYEIFTSPDYRTTNGIIYSSKPLIYNGKIIDKFYIEFKNGKAINYHAEEGEDILKEIIESDKNACYLGEVALVNYDSPISNTNKVFKSTLIDENASCHVALGSGFLECIQNGENLTKAELQKLGLNESKNHVDFMIGTKDLKIVATTKDGEVVIMDKGNLTI